MTSIIKAGTIKVNTIQSSGETTAFTIDDSGRMLKGTSGNLVAFRAYPSGSFNASSGAFNVDTDANLKFSQTEYNYGNHYSTTTGRFVAPVSGLYQFVALIAVNNNTNTYAYLSAEVHVWAGNGSSHDRIIGGWDSKLSSTNAYDKQINVQVIPLSQGDGVSIGYECATAGVPIAGGSRAYSNLTGYLIG